MDIGPLSRYYVDMCAPSKYCVDMCPLSRYCVGTMFFVKTHVRATVQ